MADSLFSRLSANLEAGLVPLTVDAIMPSLPAYSKRLTKKRDMRVACLAGPLKTQPQ